MFSNTKSCTGNKCAQVFVDGDAECLAFYPMKQESQGPLMLNNFVYDFGIPVQIHSDNAKMETVNKDWRKPIDTFSIYPTTTEPYTPWQNFAEREIQEIKKDINQVMDRKNIPDWLWDATGEYIAECWHHHARKKLNWRTPLEAMTGDTPDLSHLLHFDYYQPVYYLTPSSFPETKEKLGRWLGPAKNVGDAMTWKILTEKKTIIARSAVRPADDKETPNLRQSTEEFDKAMKGIKMESEEDGQDDTSSLDSTVIFDEEPPGLSNETFSDEKENADEMIGAKVILQKDGEKAKATILGQKRYADGTPIGGDEIEKRKYVVQYEDGIEETLEYSDLINFIEKQVDEEGNEWWTFDSIVGHEHRPGGRGRLKGWFLEVEWLDGTRTWQTLKSMKDSNPYEVAAYARDNLLLDDPAFSWWAKKVLKKTECWLRNLQRRRKVNRYKFGVEVPTYSGTSL